MKIFRFVALLLLAAASLCARAAGTLSFSESWQDVPVRADDGSLIGITNKGSASLTFSGYKISIFSPINFSTFIGITTGGTNAIYEPLSGDTSDLNNPVISSYKPGATSATLTFYHNTPDTNGNPHYAVTKTLKLSWTSNILSGSLTGPSGTLGFENVVGFVSNGPFVTSVGVQISGILNVSCVTHLTNSVTVQADATLNTGSVTGTGDSTSPTTTITSPAPNLSTTNPVIEVTGTVSDNLAIGPTQWRLAAPIDDPSNPSFFFWNLADHFNASFPKTSSWSTSVTLQPGTNWFWAYTVDLAGNNSTIVTRKFFYSTRSQLTLGTNGNGAIVASRGVTNGAMLEVGRGYTVTGRPKDTNTVFVYWSNGDGSPVSNLNPWNFQMQSNMTIVGNFIPNPFPAIAGTYSGIFFDTFRPPVHHDPSPDNSGYTSITVKPDGTFTGTVLFGAGRYPIRGMLRYDLLDTNTVYARAIIGRPPELALNIAFPSDGSGHLLPTPTLSVSISGLPLSPMPLLQSSNTVPPGLYNFVDNVANLSIGASYGSVMVTPVGQANIVMHLADGSPAVTFSTPVRNDGSIAIFIPLASGNGMVLATMNLEDLYPAHAGGGRWVKPANPRAKIYPGGFVENLDLVVGKYTPDIGKTILSSMGVGEIVITNDTLNYSAQVVYSPASHRIVAMPGQTNVTMDLILNPATGLVAGTITFAGHNPFLVNALITGENIGYTLDTDHSVLVILRGAPIASLGTYDDGFVLADESSTDAGYGATAYFSFQNTSQLVTTPLQPPPPPPLTRDVEMNPPTIAIQVLMHRRIQIAPHQRFIITDTFDSIDIQYPGLYPALPSTGPYTGPINPADFAAPAVTITPTQRTTQYVAD